MNKFVKNLSTNKRGSMFLFVMMFGFIAFTSITLGITSYVIYESRAAKQDYQHDTSLSIAEAGIDYYRWHLNDFPDDYYDGHGVQSFGPHYHDYYDKNNNLVGTFSLTIIPPVEGTHVVEVRSTGWSNDNPSRKRTIKVYFGYESFSDSSFVDNTSVTFSPTSFVHGKTFSNGCIHFNGGSDSWVDSAQGAGACSGNNGVYGSGGPQEFWRYGLPIRSFASVGSDFSALLAMADEPDGLHLSHSNKGWHLVFQANGTFDLYQVVSISSGADILSQTGQGNRVIPANGVIYSDSDIWVDGTVNGRVTVVADAYNSVPSNIVIPGNLVYNEKHSDDVIGLMSYSDLIVPYDVPDNMEIDGVLLSASGEIYRPFFSSSYGPKYLRSSLSVFGSQIQYIAGGFKYGTAPNYSSGFVTTTYTYDGNLLYFPPVGIPYVPNYKLIGWQEIQPGDCDADNPCPARVCGGDTSVSYSGQNYDLAIIGDQCWFAENLNVGTKIDNTAAPVNNSLIEKWCYDNSDANCTTEGGLYTWAEAMQLDPSCNSITCNSPTSTQGICPTGWHIPTNDEIKTMEVYLGMCTGSGSGCVDSSGQYRGTNQGTQLKIGGTSGFNFPLSGYRFTSNAFDSRGSTGFLWSASEYDNANAWYRFVSSNDGRVFQIASNKAFGLSARCIRNPAPCGGETTVSDSDGQNYDLIEVGDQCWVGENLNVGTMLNSGTTPSNNSSIEKWCYNNDVNNCAVQGGLYTWAEAMQLDPSCNNSSCAGSITVNHQGVCPNDFHIPTDNELKTLEINLGMSQAQADATGYRGTDESTKLKLGGTSGFNMLLSGTTLDGGSSFVNQGDHGGMWSASEVTDTNNAWGRIFSTASGINRSSDEDKIFGYNVRCLKNSAVNQSIPNGPSTPIINSLTDYSSTTIRVNWDNVSGASYYTVSSSDTLQHIKTVSYPAVDYLFSSLNPNTNYSFQVKVTDNYGQSSNYSNIVSDYTNAAIPINLLATATSTSAIALSWSNNSNATSTVYEVYNVTEDVFVVTTTATNYTVTGFQPYTTHGFKVRAENFGNSGTYSSYSTITSTTTNKPDPLRAPVLSGFYNVSGNSIQVNWGKVAGANYYTVSSTISGQSLVTTTLVNFNFTGLAPNTSYSFQVKVTDSYDQDSGYSSIGSTTTLNTPNPPLPPTITSSTSGLNSIIVNWTNVYGANYYTVSMSSPSVLVTTTYDYTGGLQTFTVPSGVTSITVDALGARGGGTNGYSTYQSNGGNGGRVQGTIAVTPGHILNITVGGQGGQTGAAGYGGGGADAAYSTVWPGAGGGGASTIIDNTTTTTLFVAGGGGGGGGYSAGGDVGGAGGTTTGGSGVSYFCPTIGGVGGSQVAGGAGDVCNGYTGSNGSFGTGGASAATDGSGGGGGGYYGGGGGAYGSGGGGGSNYANPSATGIINTQGYNSSNGQVTISYYMPPGITSVTTTQNSQLFNNLYSNTQYSFQVSATDAYSQTSASSSVYSTSTLHLPDTPVISSVTSTGPTIMNINWGSVSDATYYTVSSTNAGTVTTSLTNATFSTLAPNTYYTFQVKAIDQYGQSSGWSTAVGNYTISSIPASLSATMYTSQSVKLVWDANYNPANTYYEVYNNNTSQIVTLTASTNYIVPNLTASTSYSFKVCARYLSSPSTCSSYTSNAISYVDYLPCPDLSLSINYSGIPYPLVAIGTQCWFAKNLNVGTMLASGATVPSNNSLIEKWCFSNNSANCTTYGGLYTWAEANQLPASCNTSSCVPGTPSQGICPVGWHIPTDAEIKTLEVYLGMCTGAGAGCVDAIDYRGTDQGTQLKSAGVSGFNFPFAGYRHTNGTFNLQGSYGYLWSASAITATNAWYRNFGSTEARVYLNNSTKASGFSVRCLKN